MIRTIRCQGAIVRDDYILLIKHHEHTSGRAYWLLPGGGIEPEETEEACVVREMREETNLDVSVDRLLLDEPDVPLGHYLRLKTYLCKVVNGEAKPGHEPEAGAAQQYTISEVRWFDLRNSSEREAQGGIDPFLTFPLLQRIRDILGYSSDNE